MIWSEFWLIIERHTHKIFHPSVVCVRQKKTIRTIWKSIWNHSQNRLNNLKKLIIWTNKKMMLQICYKKHSMRIDFLFISSFAFHPFKSFYLHYIDICVFFFFVRVFIHILESFLRHFASCCFTLCVPYPYIVSFRMKQTPFSCNWP